MKARTAIIGAFCFLFLTIAARWSPAEPVGTQLTFTEGQKWYTDWSPDGKWITYAERGSDGLYNVMIVPSPGGEPVNFTPDIGVYCIFPNFSTNSKTVIFSNHGPDDQDTSDWAINSVHIKSGKRKVLVENATNGFMSHDGKSIAYRRADTANLALYDMRGKTDTVIGLVDPTDPTWGRYGVPGFSPDDELVITSQFMDLSGLYKLYSVPRDGGDYEQLTFSDGSHWYPDFTRDGEWMLFTNFSNHIGGLRQVWVMHMPTGQEMPVFPNMEDIDHWCGSFSPDGSKLSYIVDNQVYIADFSVEQYDHGTQLTFDGNFKGYTTDWSPDGQWIAYNIIGQSLSIIPSAGGDPEFLTAGIWPSFTPDSREVTYNNRPERQIESIDIDTKEKRVVISDESYKGWWSHDGSYMVYGTNGGNKLVVHDFQNGTKRTLVDVNYTMGICCFTPDDSQVITTLHEGVYRYDEKLYSIPFEGGDPVQLTFHDGRHYYPDCSRDGEWILYTSFMEGVPPLENYHSIYAYNTLTGLSISVFPGSPYSQRDASFSPDGSQFCYNLDSNGLTDVFIADFPLESQVITVVANIIEEIETLEDAGEINRGIANSLIRKLEGAISKLEQGNTTAAVSKLQAFINHLEAIRGKKIDEADADKLIAAAEELISVISSGGGVAKQAVSMEETEQESELPGIYSLKQNSPNPFNPTTTISFSLAEAGNVTVEVFNLAGQKVDTIANEFMDAGSHSVVWDATDYAGHKVSSGIYIYQLQAGEFMKSNKMILMR